jgi:hypothetical protein
MTLPTLDRAVIIGRLARIAQLRATYAPKTGQTGQTGRCIENARKFGATPGQKLTSRHAKLVSPYQKPASGTGQPKPAAQDVRTPINSAYARPNGVPQP